MKITREQIIDHRLLVGHFVMDAIARFPEILNAVVETGEADVLITVNGQEVDLPAFCEFWESQVDDMINRKALELIRDKFNNLNTLLYELEKKVAAELGEES